MSEQTDGTGTLDLDEYRKKREKDGTWPPAQEDRDEYWRRYKEQRPNRSPRSLATEFISGECPLGLDDFERTEAYYQGTYMGPTPDTSGSTDG